MSNSSLQFPTLVDLLHFRALVDKERVAYRWLVDGEWESETLTWGQLEAAAIRIAYVLRSTKQCEGRPVLLLYPPGLEFIKAFWGCLYAGAIATPAYPPRQNLHWHRLQSIISDTGSTIVLTNQSVLVATRERFRLHFADNEVRWITTDNLDTPERPDWESSSIHPNSVALLQYTSGSTSSPKGVMITHSNILCNQSMIQRAFGQDSSSIILSWLPMYHDMGLIGGVLQAVYNGCVAILMSPVSFLQRPFRWLQAISLYGATTSGGPNFAYELCTRKITANQRQSLNLCTWKVAFNGAELIRAETLSRFARLFGECGFQPPSLYPCYGLAEATLLVTSRAPTANWDAFNGEWRCSRRDVPIEMLGWSHRTPQLVSSGRAVEQIVRIVNPETGAVCKPEQSGEIWISGPNVAMGYWNNPQETRQTFGAQLEDEPDRIFLRSGDIGFISQDQLFITGRLKDLLIIRGVNYYPYDIELTAARSSPELHPDQAAAFSVEAAGEERAVLVQEISRKFAMRDANGLIEAIRRHVAEENSLQLHAVVLIREGTLPRTSSGKIQRFRCRAQFLAGSLAVVAQWREEKPSNNNDLGIGDDFTNIESAESWLKSKVSLLLGVAQEQLDLDQPIESLGLDSVNSLEIVHALDTHGVGVEMAALLEMETLREFAKEIIQRSKGSLPETSVHPEDGDKLSYGQQALWFINQLAPRSCVHNLSTALRIRGELDLTALQWAAARLVARHDALRTSFHWVDGKTVRRVPAAAEVQLSIRQSSGWDEQSLQQELARHADIFFDLEKAPLARISVFSLLSGEHVLLFTLHHIIADFWSVAVLVRELCDAYTEMVSNSIRLVLLPSVSYGRFVEWQIGCTEGLTGEQHLQYWRTQLKGVAPLQLPSDRHRSHVQTYAGGSQTFRIRPDVATAFRKLGREESVTLFTVLLATFQVLLYRYVRQNDIAVGTPTSGRSRAAFRGLVGYCVNPVVMRSRVEPQKSFISFLSTVREVVGNGLKHQDYPFSLLAEKLQLRRTTAQSPLFQLMFTHLGSVPGCPEEAARFAVGDESARINLGALELTCVPLQTKWTEFDITANVAECGEELAVSIQFNSGLFERATIERLVNHWRRLLGDIADHPSCSIDSLSLLSKPERDQLLVSYNETRVPYPHDRCVHELFVNQVNCSPGARAIVCGDEKCTYLQLEERSNRLAQYLVSLGARPDVPIGVCMERSPDMVVALLAILKSGAAYLPLDPGYPSIRLQFMIEDTDTRLIVCTQATETKVSYPGRKWVCLDAERPEIDACSSVGPTSKVTSLNLAYVIYTSGSTGTPKGVMVSHRSIVNFIGAMDGIAGNNPTGVWLAATSISFDISVFELFWPLSRGLQVTIQRESRSMADFSTETNHRPTDVSASERAVTHFQCTPSMAKMVHNGGGWQLLRASVQKLLLGGEAVPLSLIQDLRDNFSGEIYNLYGPTETTIWSTACKIESTTSAISLGRPIANTYIYVLDEHLQAVPTGVPGEIYIGGDGLARGYWLRPDLTAERFLPNPHCNDSGSRMYRTGDVGRFSPEGPLEFLGRTDHQVKIRGHRIELGEVEHCIRQHPAVKDVAIVVDQELTGDSRLVACLITAEPHVVYDEELKTFLRSLLPWFMVPESICSLGKFPTTPNGKLDRDELRLLAMSHRAPSIPTIDPRDALERVVAGVWAEALHVNEVGIYDNYFKMGGHSLLATQLVSRLRMLFRIELSLASFLENPTVADLTSFMLRQYGPRMMQTAEVLEELSATSDAEVESLLNQKSGTPQPD